MNFEQMTKEELIEYINSLNEEKNGKYGLVWDKEKEPEKIVVDCDKYIPILNEYKNKFINNKKPNLINNKVLKYESIEVPYFCRENSEVLLFETCNSSRDYKKLLKYIDSNRNKLEEWENNFELIVDYGKYNEFESARKEIKDKKIFFKKACSRI